MDCSTPRNGFNGDRLTWSALCYHEPKLANIEAAIARSAPPTDYAGFWAEWENWKLQFCELVGWGACNPRLKTSEAYDVTYHHLFVLHDNAADRQGGAL